MSRICNTLKSAEGLPYGMIHQKRFHGRFVAMLHPRRHKLRFQCISGWWLSLPSEKWWSSSNGSMIPNVWKNKTCLKPPTRDLYIECIYKHVYIHIYIYNRHLSQSQVLRWCFFFTRPTTQGFWNKFYLWHVRVHASRMIIFSYWQCFLGLVAMFPLFSI